MAFPLSQYPFMLPGVSLGLRGASRVLTYGLALFHGTCSPSGCASHHLVIKDVIPSSGVQPNPGQAWLLCSYQSKLWLGMLIHHTWEGETGGLPSLKSTCAVE